MSETEKNNFIGYEYKDITVKRDMEALYVDSYPYFGWVLDGTSPAVKGLTHVTLKFKRDRKIKNKAELTRLQHQFESHAKEIERLEMSKVVGASTVAYVVGVFGTAFMACSVFSYLAGMLPLSIILAVPGVIGWIIPYFCYEKIKSKKTDEVSPIIEQKYDAIYETCEKANRLVNLLHPIE
ncbi:hypothetical protein, partial [Thermoanaerobacterium thermosaccharolyticum]